MFFVLLGSVYGDDEIDGVDGSAYLLAGILGYGVSRRRSPGSRSCSCSAARDGVLKRVRGTPLPPWAYLVAVIVSTLVVYAIEAVSLIVARPPPLRRPLPDALARRSSSRCCSGRLAFAALGLALTGAVRSARRRFRRRECDLPPDRVHLGLFFSATRFPPFLEAIADVLPLTYFIQLIRDVLLQNEPIWDNGSR